jgi:ATP-dependent helicase YprA (DUF1998 family)
MHYYVLLLQDDRREIEGKLFSGNLLGVTATSALELGIDIGELDVTLHLGMYTVCTHYSVYISMLLTCIQCTQQVSNLVV